MTKKQYHFLVQVQVTLDDQDKIGFALPTNLSLQTKKQVLDWLNGNEQDRDRRFENLIYESTDCFVKDIRVCLE
jgi:hypothetical protein